jgi:hypothetical protein
MIYPVITDIGRRVIFTPEGWEYGPGRLAEIKTGVVTGYKGEWVFVRFGVSYRDMPKEIRRERLSWAVDQLDTVGVMIMSLPPGVATDNNGAVALALSQLGYSGSMIGEYLGRIMTRLKGGQYAD